MQLLAEPVIGFSIGLDLIKVPDQIRDFSESGIDILEYWMEFCNFYDRSLFV